jgi:hypothetical protein
MEKFPVTSNVDAFLGLARVLALREALMGRSVKKT